jgi:hypothetical protein
MSGRSLFLLWVTAVALNACSVETVATWSNCNTGNEVVRPLVISSNDTLNLYLDSLMVMGISTPVDYQAKRNVLYAFDSYNKRLLAYPLDAKGRIYPESIHPVKINQKISYIRYISPDTLILYTYGGARLSYYTLKTDTIYKSLTFINRDAPRLKGNAAAHPYANAAAPLFFYDNKIIGAGFLLGEKENENMKGRTICTAIDLSSGNISHHLPYSNVYAQQNWGGSHMRTPFTTFNEQTKKLILSLPADHNIQIVDGNWQIAELYAGSRKRVCITSKVRPKSKDKAPDAEDALAYYTSTPSYRNIIYDPYHERYYRLLEWPPAEKEQSTGKLAGKQASLIAFDKDFKYLGEADLPDALALDNFFITDKGLYFLNANNKDQNVAQYVQCNVEL